MKVCLTRVSISVIAILLFFFISKPASLYFLNDDNVHIPLSKSFHFLYGTGFRPVSDLTLLIDYSVWKKNAIGYHLTNIFFHVLTTVLVYFFARCLFQKYCLPSLDNNKHFWAALLFFFYPFHSEAIFWIIGRGGLLSALFGISSLLYYLKREQHRGYLFLSILFFLIGALAYETIWIVPLVIIVFSFLDAKKMPLYKKRIVWDAGVFWMIFILYIIARSVITGDICGTPYGDKRLLKFDLNIVFKNFNALIARHFLPPLSSTAVLIGLYILIIGVILFLLLNIYRTRKNKNGVLLFLGLLFIAVLPCITIGIDSHDSEGERLLYFSSVFAVLFLIELIYVLTENYFKRIISFCILLLISIFYLNKSAHTYQISSEIARKSIEVVQSLKGIDTLYAINIPTQYKGAFIFRMAFPGAIRWLTDNTSINVIEVSKREIIRPVIPYKVFGRDINILPAVINGWNSKIKRENTAVMLWTDSQIQVFK